MCRFDVLYVPVRFSLRIKKHLGMSVCVCFFVCIQTDWPFLGTPSAPSCKYLNS